MLVKANESLFKDWNILSHKIRSLASIVQNDLKLPISDITEWNTYANIVSTHLTKLIADTNAYLTPSVSITAPPNPGDDYLFRDEDQTWEP